MGIFDRFFKPPVVSAPTGLPTEIQSMEVIPAAPQNFVFPVVTDHRPGMWIKTSNGRIGVLHKFLDEGFVEVHLTDAQGTTLTSEEQPLSEVIRARQSEIPNTRIKHLSRNELRALGYED